MFLFLKTYYGAKLEVFIGKRYKERGSEDLTGNTSLH